MLNAFCLCLTSHPVFAEGATYKFSNVVAESARVIHRSADLVLWGKRLPLNRREDISGTNWKSHTNLRKGGKFDF